MEWEAASPEGRHLSVVCLPNWSNTWQQLRPCQPKSAPSKPTASVIERRACGALHLEFLHLGLVQCRLASSSVPLPSAVSSNETVISCRYRHVKPISAATVAVVRGHGACLHRAHGEPTAATCQALSVARESICHSALGSRTVTVLITRTFTRPNTRSVIIRRRRLSGSGVI